MSDTFVCVNCKKRRKANPRLKLPQLYCDDSICQNARKAKWKREKMRLDPSFKVGHSLDCQDWRDQNRGYWRNYRRSHPHTVQRNRELQMIRDIRRKQRVIGSDLAKVDALKSKFVSGLENESTYWLVPFLAKVDALRVKLVVISDN